MRWTQHSGLEVRARLEAACRLMYLRWPSCRHGVCRTVCTYMYVYVYMYLFNEQQAAFLCTGADGEQHHVPWQLLLSKLVICTLMSALLGLQQLVAICHSGMLSCRREV